MLLTTRVLHGRESIKWLSGADCSFRFDDTMGDLYTTVAQFDDIGWVNHGATFIVGRCEFFAECEYYDGSPKILARLQKIEAEKGYVITSYKFYNRGEPAGESLEERLFSNRTEYFINGVYVGTYYSDEYIRALTALNRRVTVKLGQPELVELTDPDPVFQENALLKIERPPPKLLRTRVLHGWEAMDWLCRARCPDGCRFSTVPDWGDLYLTLAEFDDFGWVNHGAAFVVGRCEFFAECEHYGGDPNELQKIEAEKGYVITSYKFYNRGQPAPHSLVEEYLSNRTEYYIDGAYVGTDEYIRALISLNRRITVKQGHPEIIELTVPDPAFQENALLKIKRSIKRRARRRGVKLERCLYFEE